MTEEVVIQPIRNLLHSESGMPLIPSFWKSKCLVLTEVLSVEEQEGYLTRQLSHCNQLLSDIVSECEKRSDDSICEDFQTIQACNSWKELGAMFSSAPPEELYTVDMLWDWLFDLDLKATRPLLSAAIGASVLALPPFGKTNDALIGYTLGCIGTSCHQLGFSQPAICLWQRLLDVGEHEFASVHQLRESLRSLDSARYVSESVSRAEVIRRFAEVLFEIERSVDAANLLIAENGLLPTDFDSANTLVCALSREGFASRYPIENRRGQFMLVLGYSLDSDRGATLIEGWVGFLRANDYSSRSNVRKVLEVSDLSVILPELSSRLIGYLAFCKSDRNDSPAHIVNLLEGYLGIEDAVYSTRQATRDFLNTAEFTDRVPNPDDQVHLMQSLSGALIASGREKRALTLLEAVLNSGNGSH